MHIYSKSVCLSVSIMYKCLAMTRWQISDLHTYARTVRNDMFHIHGDIIIMRTWRAVLMWCHRLTHPQTTHNSAVRVVLILLVREHRWRARGDTEQKIQGGWDKQQAKVNSQTAGKRTWRLTTGSGLQSEITSRLSVRLVNKCSVSPGLGFLWSHIQRTSHESEMRGCL